MKPDGQLFNKPSPDLWCESAKIEGMNKIIPRRGYCLRTDPFWVKLLRASGDLI